MKLPALFAGLLLCAALAHASQWFTVAEADPAANLPLVEVDLATVQVRDGMGTGTIRMTYPVLMPHTGRFGYRSVVANSQFDCGQQAVTYTTATYYALPAGEGMKVGSDTYARDNGMPALFDNLPAAAKAALLKATCSTVSR